MTFVPIPYFMSPSRLRLAAGWWRTGSLLTWTTSTLHGLPSCSRLRPAAGWSLGGSSLLASDLAGAVRPDKRWAFNGTTCARLAGSGKVSVLFWLESLQSALRVELGIHEGKLQGQYLRQLVEGPILDQLLRKIEELPDLQRDIIGNGSCNRDGGSLQGRLEKQGQFTKNELF